MKRFRCGAGTAETSDSRYRFLVTVIIEKGYTALSKIDNDHYRFGYTNNTEYNNTEFSNTSSSFLLTEKRMMRKKNAKACRSKARLSSFGIDCLLRLGRETLESI